MSVTISELLQGISSVESQQNLTVSGLAEDSRDVSLGDGFIAYPGAHVDGRAFIAEAIAAGAVVVIYDDSDEAVTGFDVPCIPVSDLHRQVATIAARFYGNPSEEMTVIGVTGTNGKTSVSQFIAKSLQASGQQCAVVGTLGNGFLDDLQASRFTTPFPVQLQAQLREFQQQGANAVAMEVSSHGLAQHRVDAVAFDVAVFTNLTRDHLDYHGDIKSYREAKRRLFEFADLKTAVINADDEFGLMLIQALSTTLDVVAFSARGDSSDVPMVNVSDLNFMPTGFTAHLKTPWGEGWLESRLLGQFNVSNVLAVIATLGSMGVPLNQMLTYVSQLTTVCGRMQTFGGGDQPLVVVDYAHTPDALVNALTALRAHCAGKIWCVFGAGGDRDRGKRKMMGQVVEQYSDQLIITDDNPRSEAPEQIVQDIMSGLLCPWAAEVEHDRQAAIAHALSCAASGDVVLVAGKGHETFQIVGTERFPFSDVAQVRAQLGAEVN